MKKKIIFLSALPLLLITLVGCTKKQETVEWPNKDKVMAVKSSDIKAITYVVTSESGEVSNEISDPETIEEIYNLLSNMEIQDKTDIAYDDYGTQLIFSLPEDEVPFNFEKDILILSDDERYVVSNFNPLRKLLEEYEKPIITLPNGFLEARNNNGYAFEYEPTDILVTEASFTTIFTGGEKGTIPFYYVNPMDITDQTIDEMIESQSKYLIEHHGPNMIEQPKQFTYHLGEWDVTGIQYKYKEDDKEYYGHSYYMPYSDTKYMSWTCFHEVEDTKTPADLFHAMETFHFLEG